MIKKLVAESIYILSEEDVRKLKEVNVYYSDNTYRDDVKHITELAQSIVKDYPRMKYSDMHVCYISDKMSRMHAYHTTVQIAISVEDYLRYKKSHEIEIM